MKLLLLLSNRGVVWLLLHYYLTSTKVSQVNNMSKSQCCPLYCHGGGRGVELLVDGDLISLACQLVVPLCERGTIVACEAKSVFLHPASLSDDAEAEIFLNDVTVEGPAGVFRLEVLVTR